MKFQELTSSGYAKALQAFGADALDAIRYVEFMAASMHKNIADWDIEPFTTRGNFLKDRPTINKRFMEVLSSEMLKPTGNESAMHAKLSSDDVAKILQIAQNRSIPEKDRLLRQREDTIQNMRALATRYNDAHRSLVAVNERINAINPSVFEHFVKDIELILQDNFWEYNGVQVGRDSGYVSFLTRAPIVLVEQNKTAGIDNKVNMGRFEVRLMLTTLQANVHAYRNCLQISDITHPHVLDNKICWGQINDALVNAINNMDLKRIMALTKSLLTSYNPDSPYRALFEFKIMRMLADFEQFDGICYERSTFYQHVSNTLKSLNKVQATALEALQPFLGDLKRGATLDYIDGVLAIKTPAIATGDGLLNEGATWREFSRVDETTIRCRRTGQEFPDDNCDGYGFSHFVVYGGLVKAIYVCEEEHYNDETGTYETLEVFYDVDGKIVHDDGIEV